MFCIYLDGEILHKNNTKAIARDISLNLEDNSAGTLSFTIDNDHPAYAYVSTINKSHEVYVVDNGDEIFRGRIVSSSDGDYHDITFNVEGQLAYLNDSLVRPFATYADDNLKAGTTLIGNTADIVVEYLIRNHNIYGSSDTHVKLGKCEVNSQLNIVVEDYSTVGSCLSTHILDDLGAHAKMYMKDGVRYLDILDNGGGLNGQKVELGVNLKSYGHEADSSEIYTAIVPEFTIGDQNYTIDQVITGGIYNDIIQIDDSRAINTTAAAEYGLKETHINYRAVDKETAAQLLFSDVEMLSDVYDTVTISAVDLSLIDPTIQPFRLLDWVEIVAREYNIDKWMMCSAISMSDDPTKTEYTFGTILPTLTAGVVRSEKAYNGMSNG